MKKLLQRVAVVAGLLSLLLIPIHGLAESQSQYQIATQFQSVYDSSGGIPVFGYPSSDPMTIGGLLVQYFERARFEHHPELAGTPYEVQLARVGYDEAESRDLLDTGPFQPLSAGGSDGNCVFFNETGHRLCSGFREFWQDHGLDLGDQGVTIRESLALFGYPISEEFTDPTTGFTVQYFERARFEYHPEFAGTSNAVELGLLGNAQYERFKVKTSHGHNSSSTPVPTPTPAPTATPTPTPTPTAASTVTATPTSTPQPTILGASTGTWHLQFGDEFNGTTLDTSKWMTHYPDGTPGSTSGRNLFGNNELEYYTDNSVSEGNGILRISAQRQSVAGYSYTSGIINSYPSFSTTYGFIEMKARIPKGQGLWPAFWLLPSNVTWPPETDIMEAIGSDSGTVAMSNHHMVNGQLQSDQQFFFGSDLSTSFHTFGLEWSPTQLVWYIDGIERARMTNAIPNQPMYIIANLAVGGNWPGSPDASTPFPSYFDIDYIRVFQH